MQPLGRQTQWARGGGPLHGERRLLEQTTLCRLLRPHAASFIGIAEASTGSELARFINDELNACLDGGIGC